MGWLIYLIFVSLCCFICFSPVCCPDRAVHCGRAQAQQEYAPHTKVESDPLLAEEEEDTSIP